MRTPSVYHYFKGKKVILRSLSSYGVDESAAFATDMVSGGGRAAVSLYRMLHAHITLLTSGPYDLWFLIKMPGPSSNPCGKSKVIPCGAMRSWRSSSAACPERSAPALPLVALYSMVGSVNGAMARRRLNAPSKPHELVDVVLRGLAVNSGVAEEICAAAKASP